MTCPETWNKHPNWPAIKCPLVWHQCERDQEHGGMCKCSCGERKDNGR